jgi:acylpyruvate hydrolase
MKLVTIADGGLGEAGAMLDSGEILHFRRAADPASVEAWIPNSVSAILAAQASGLSVVRELVNRVQNDLNTQHRLRQDGALLAESTRLLAPIPAPRLVVAAGLAYRSHLAEMAGTPQPSQPTGFLKTTASVIGPGASVLIPPHASAHIDYEGELAVVFAKRCHFVTPADAMAYVAGYTAANDISARDWVKSVWGAKQPWEARQTWEVNIMGKQFEGFTPLGPVLLTADEVPDVSKLELITRLNGVVMQQAFVSDLIFPIAQTISYFSQWYTFEPGDILLTGTPAGVGVGRQPPVFMQPSDQIEIEITGVGILRNTVVAPVDLDDYLNRR